MSKSNKTISPECLDIICTLIHEYSGIQISGAHVNHIKKHIEDCILKQNISEQSYLQTISTSQVELSKLVNIAAINETYFFREEKQFELLNQVIFPKYKKHAGKIKIWSAACSTGEEAISLSAIANNHNLDAEIWATDINDENLNSIKTKSYSQNSFRLDGSKFYNLLLTKELFNTQNFEYYPTPEFTKNIHIMKYNLASKEQPPIELKNMDIVFLRNVFIYFDEKTRKNILLKICDSMKENATLFLATSETASIITNTICPQLKKVKTNNVYYFMKQTSKNKNLNIPTKKNNTIPTVKKNQFISNIKKNTDYENFFALILAKLENDQKDTVTELVKDFTYSVNKQDISAYIRGFVALECGNFKEAQIEFIKAEVINPNLWPAFFLHAGLLKGKNEKKSIQLFKDCKTILKKYITNNQTHYDYLLKPFSSKYYYTLCCKYLEGRE